MSEFDYMSEVRKSRGLQQKIYLIETIIPKDDLLQREFIVMGSTNNVYHVSIKNKPTCTCPDYTTRYKRCKHIFFILLRIMKISKEDQDTYSDEELNAMFTNIPKVIDYMCIDKDLKLKYDAKKKQLVNSTLIKDQKNLDDDCCPICLDDLTNGESLVFCKYSCGKNIHSNCFDMMNKKKENKDIICVFCRHNWDLDPNQTSKYINLS